MVTHLKFTPTGCVTKMSNEKCGVYAIVNLITQPVLAWVYFNQGALQHSFHFHSHHQLLVNRDLLILPVLV